MNRRYLEQGELNVEIMGRGYAWLDTGTHDSLLEAASFIATLQKRQGLQVSCPRAVIGPGSTIMAGAIVGTEARLGCGVIVSCGAVVDLISNKFPASTGQDRCRRPGT